MARHGNRDCTIGGSRHISAPCTMRPLTRNQKPEPWNKSGRAKAVAWRFLGVLSQVPSHCGRLTTLYQSIVFRIWSTSPLSFSSASALRGSSNRRWSLLTLAPSHALRISGRTSARCLSVCAVCPRNLVIAANGGPGVRLPQLSISLSSASLALL